MSDNSKFNGDMKINILFVILLIFNILLFVKLFGYVTSNHVAIFALNTGEPFWVPYLEMLKLLSLALILIFVASKFDSFKSVVQGKTSLKENIWMIVIFSILGILASYFVLDVINGVHGNVRGFVVMISALIAGPYVGVPVALISGGWRLLLGGPTALPCAIATILAGLIGSLVYKFNDGKFLSIPKSAIFMFLFSGLDMFIIAVLAPNGIAIANALYGPMTFTAVVGILLFKFISEK